MKTSNPYKREITMENTDSVTTLDKLEVGKDVIIKSVNCEDKALRRHILNMGLTPETEVTLIKTAPMGDPLELRVRGYELTLRKSDASKIEIYNIHNAHNHTKTIKNFEYAHPQFGEDSFYEKDGDKKAVRIKGKIKLALAGNQNSGKTTLFNKLTGSTSMWGISPGLRLIEPTVLSRIIRMSQLPTCPEFIRFLPTAMKKLSQEIIFLTKNLTGL